MIVRFATYEEAGIYAGWMRSEGHYAGILDENMGFFWGPLAIGGFRVCVTEAPVENDEPLPENPPLLDKILDGIRLVVVALASFGLIAPLAIASRSNDINISRAGDFMVFLVILAAVFSCLGPLMVPATRAMRDEHTVLGGLVRGLVVCYFAGYWLIMLITIVLAIYQSYGQSE